MPGSETDSCPVLLPLPSAAATSCDPRVSLVQVVFSPAAQVSPGNGAQEASTGKGKPPTTGAGYRPRVMVVLRGKLASAPGVSGTSFSLNVTGTNGHGKAYNASTVTVAIDATTMVRRNGAKDQASLMVGDRALVQARACKADLANGGKPALTAVRIIAHPAKA